MAFTKVPGELIEPVVAGVKTFTDGVVSEEEVLLDSTLNPYASIRTKNLAGVTKDVVLATGDSSGDISGNAIIATGSATNTAPSPMSIQGLTITHLGIGRPVNLSSVEILVDNTNITNPLAPNFALRGSAGQRLVIRVNSATTVNDVVAAFALLGPPFSTTYTVTGSALTTFINEVQYFSGAKGPGEVILESGYQARLESNTLMLGQTDAPYGQVFITSADVTGSQNSDTIFLITGRVKGTGNSGGISIRSTDVEGSGGSGGTFIRTGSVNGSIASGNTQVGTGATNSFATANSGGLTLFTGNISGTSGNSGALNANSGRIISGSGTSGQVTLISGDNNGSGQTGGTGMAVLRSGDMSGANSGVTGNVTVRSGHKTNGSATGNTGDLALNTGNNNGAGNSGNLNIFSGSASTGQSGLLSISTGNVTSGTLDSGSVGINSGTSLGGTSGFLNIQSGNASNAQNSGGLALRTGNVVSGTAGFLNVTSGDASGSGSSGGAQFGSGQASSGFSGFVTFKSGDVVDGFGGTANFLGGNNTGVSGNGSPVNVIGGNITGANVGGVTGWVHVNSGDVTNAASTATSAEAVFRSGDVAGSGGSAQALIRSGNTASNNSGPVNIQSGSVSGGVGNSGDINLSIGSSAGGVRGKIKLQDGSEGTVNHIWTQTAADGSGAWQAAPVELPDQTGNGGKILTTDGSVVSWTSSVADLELTGNPTLKNTFLSSYSNGGAGNTISLFSSQGTFDTPTASLAGDSLLFLGGRGHDGTSYNAGSKAAITINTSENHTPTANGTQITFATAENGTTTRKNRVRVENTGAITFFGNTSGSISLKPAAVTTTHTLNLPASNASGALTNDGSGNLSWAAAGGGGLPAFSQHFNSGAFTPTTTTNNTWGTAPTVATLTLTGSFAINDEIIIKLDTLLTLFSPSGTGTRGGSVAIFDHNNNLIWAKSGRFVANNATGDLDVNPICMEKRFTFSDAPVNPAFTLKVRQTDVGTDVQCGQTTTGSGGEITHEFWAFRNN